ncbi:RNA polymerase sigma factor [Rurimicrobium arvi]|uniref:RNA polymerase sigma factor n=1 Tax=Rurimicrobium arvi TaxID=2049916 RepID=A0ABP8MH54_9BACT
MQFDFIFNEHRDKVYSLCLRYLQHTQEAEDAMQEVFIKVFRKLDSFQDKAQLSTWIYRIAVNHCLDILRSKKRKQQLLRFLPFLQQEEGFSYILTHKDLSLEDKQELDRLMQHIRSLPENQFTALVLNRLEGISIERVAQIMGLSYKSVESLLQRAKQNLIKRIEATSKE